jgi:hypothetical protein
MIRRTLFAAALLSIAALLVGATAAPAQPTLVFWDYTTSPNGWWDNPSMWLALGGNPLGYAPDGTFGTDYDCLLSAPGAIAAVRQDVTVYSLYLRDQTLRLTGDSRLTLTAPSVAVSGTNTALYIEGGGVLDGRGTVLAREAILWEGAVVAARQIGHDLTLDVATLDNFGMVAAVNDGRLTINGARIGNYWALGGRGRLMAASGGKLTLNDCMLYNEPGIGETTVGPGGTLSLVRTSVGGERIVALAAPDYTNPNARVSIEDSFLGGLHLQWRANLQVTGGRSMIYGGFDMDLDAVANIQPGATLAVENRLAVSEFAWVTVAGTLELGNPHGGATLVEGLGTILLNEGTVTGSAVLQNWGGGSGNTLGIAGSGTVDVDDMELRNGAQIRTDRAGDVLTLSGHFHQGGSAGSYIVAMGDTGIVFDGADVDKALVQIGNASVDMYDSSIDRVYLQANGSGGTLTAAGGANAVAILQAHGYVAQVVVAPGATCELTDVLLENSAVLRIGGLATVTAPAAWPAWRGNGTVVLEGGRIQGDFESDLPLEGHGQLAPPPWGGTLVWRNNITARGGVLELVPGIRLAHQSPRLDVESGAELFINDATYEGYETIIAVQPGGTLRLDDALLAGYTMVQIGGGMPMAGGDPVPLFEAPPCTDAAEMIATGVNDLRAGSVDVRYDSEASIVSGETRIADLFNQGFFDVFADARLIVGGDEGGYESFQNYGAFRINGRMDLVMGAEWSTSRNDGVIAIEPGGLLALQINPMQSLRGCGTIVVGGTLDATTTAIGFDGGPPGQIMLEGGLITGSLATDCIVDGYGTITGQLTLAGFGAGLYTTQVGRTLHLTYLDLWLLAGTPCDVVVDHGGTMELANSVIADTNPDHRVLVDNSGPMAGLSRLLVRDSGIGPRIVVRGDSESEMVNFGMVHMNDVEVRTEGGWYVMGHAQAAGVQVGTMDSETMQQGGGLVYVSPEASLTLTNLEIAGHAMPSRVDVAGTLRFMRPHPTESSLLARNGTLYLQGGTIEGDGGVTMTGMGFIRGYGRINAAMTIESGKIEANQNGAWLRLSGADKVFGPGGWGYAGDGGRLAVEGIRVDNFGRIQINAGSHLLVDAGIIDNQGMGVTVIDGSYELRRGGAILGSVMMGPTSAGTIGAMGQQAGGTTPVDANQFALGDTKLYGSLTVVNPVALGAAAPDTGNTVLTVMGNLTVQSGADLTLEPDARLVVTGDVASAGTLDINQGWLIVDYDPGDPSPLASIWAQILSGSNGRTWTGTGITSSAAAADPTHLTAVGVIDNADPVGGKSQFGGVDVDATSVLVRYTWWGDINLDGAVTADDYDVIDNTYVFGLPPGRTYGWWSGDMNGDGAVDADDYDLIDNAFVFGGTPMGGSPVGLVIPEPATLALLTLGALALVRRRGR